MAGAGAAIGAWTAGLRKVVDAAGPVAVVAGNEAADADSIVSALVQAYALGLGTVTPPGCVAVPVVACAREDMRLRRETVLLLELCGVDASCLVFLDDPGVADGLLGRAASLVLTDHNRATGPLEALGAKVVEIVDHHQDMGAHEHVSGPARRVAFEGEQATAGSCCTLVAEALLAAGEEGRELLARDGGAAARALLGVIAIDTINLEPKAKKVTPRDLAAAAALEAIAPSPARADLFQRLDAAKFDAAFWETLTVGQCLRYDYKRFEAGGRSFGLASVLCPLEALAAKEGCARALAEWSAKADLFGVMAMVRPSDGGPPQRQVLLLSADGSALARRAADFAAAYEQPALALEPLELGGLDGVLAFRQGNAAASRKQVAPCLSAFFESA